MCRLGARDNGPARRVFQESAAEDPSGEGGGERLCGEVGHDNLSMLPSKASENILEAVVESKNSGSICCAIIFCLLPDDDVIGRTRTCG